MTTPITAFPITGYTISDLALVSPATGQFLEVGGSSDGRVDIDALAAYCRAGLAWSDLTAKPTTLAGYGITDAQPLDADLTALAGLSTTGVIERTGAGTAATFTVSAFAKTILDDADAATARGTLGLGTIATQSAASVAITGGSVTGITDLAVADGGTGASTAAGARTNLGATTVGSNLFTLPNPSAITFPRINADNSVSTLSAADFRTAISAQPADADLTTLAGLTWSDGNFIVGNGITWTVESGATARASLGLGTAATQTYESGLWTPTIIGSLTAGTATYSIRVANYTRIGDCVRLQFTLAWSGGTGTGSLRVSGLPFTSNGTANNFATNLGAVADMSYTAGHIPFLQIPPGATSIDIAQFPAGGGSGAIAVPYAASGVISGAIFYQV